jgi:hypothetical protein
MDAKTFEKYCNCIPSIEAHETLLNVNASMYPHMKDGPRKKLHSDLSGEVKKVIKKKQKLATFGEVINFARKMSGDGR